MGISPTPDGTSVLGKNAEDLQNGIIVNDSSIEGTLNYVTDYTGYSEDPELQEGNYIALKFVFNDEIENVKARVSSSTEYTTITNNQNVPFRIEDETLETIDVSYSKSGETTNKSYDLSGLILEEE